MTVAELLAVLIYFPPDGQDIEIRMPNGGNLEAVNVTDTGGKLRVELRGAPTVVNSSRTSEQDRIAVRRTYTPADGKARQVLKTITDRTEIARITKTSASRHGYQVR